MIEEGDEGHVVNTSSPNGGLSYMPTAAVYAASKAAVSSFSETLQNQFLADGLKLRASVFYPSGGMLKTGHVGSREDCAPRSSQRAAADHARDDRRDPRGQGEGGWLHSCPGRT